jgi:hypothetical protein
MQLIRAILLSVLPWAVLHGSYVSNPYYLQPLFTRPVGFVLLPLMLIWSIIGCYFLARARSTARIYAGITIFIVPLTLVPMLGPATITIFQSLKHML